MDIHKTGESTGSDAFIGKKSKLQKGTMAGTTILTSLVLSACGGTVATKENVFTQDGSTFTGTNLNDTLSQSGSTANLTVKGFGGADIITTGSGNDLVRAGVGSDTVDTGLGDDTIVMVGTTAVSEYSASDIPTALAGVLELSTLNGQSVSEAVSGGSIDGGGGTSDTLHLYGTMDMSTITLTGIENYVLHSNITFSALQLNQFTGDSGISMTGDTSSVLTISSAAASIVQLDSIDLTGINQLSVGDNVTVEVANQAALASIGITTLTGFGTIALLSTSGVTQSLVVDSNITVTSGATDITSTITSSVVTVSDDGNISPEYVGRSSAYLAPIASNSDVTFLADLSTIQVESVSTSPIVGFFVDVDTDSLVFTLSGTDSDKVSLQTLDGSTRLVLNANQVLEAGSTLSVDVTGTDSLGGSVSQTLSFSVAVAGDSTAQTINGTANADVLLGGTIGALNGSDADTLNGLGGNDHLNGGYGDDILNGGEGNDLLKGRFGDDELTGGLGADILSYTIFELGDKFITNDGNDTMLDFQIGTDTIQLEMIQQLGDTDTLSHFKAGFGTMWNAQISENSNQIKLVFEDAADGGEATVTLVLNETDLQARGTEAYQNFADVDAFLLAIGTEAQLDFV